MKNIILLPLMTLMVGFIFLTPVRSYGAYNAYLALTGISGESTNKNQIEVSSFSESVTGPAPTFSFVLAKPLDISSPTLYLDCAQGVIISRAILTLQSQVGQEVVFYTITLNNVSISSIQTSGSSSDDGRPTETVTVTFQSIQWTYQQLDDNGDPVGSPVTTSYTISRPV